MSTWPRGRPPALVPVRLPDGLVVRVGWDIAETLLKSRRATAAPGVVARVLPEKPL